MVGGLNMKSNSFFGFDVIIPLAATTLAIFGILFIYSSGVTSTGEIYSNEYIKQIVWVVSGLLFFFVILFSEYTQIKNFAVYIYVGCIGLLLITLIIGERINGAKSWIGVFGFGVQPSEFMKIGLILFLAKYFETRRNRINTLNTFLLGSLILLIPAGLVLLQPDLGTAIVYFPIFVVISFVAGTKIRYIVFFTFYCVGTILLSVLPYIERYFIHERVSLIRLITQIEYFRYFIGAVTLVTVISALGYLIVKKKYYYWIMYASSLSAVSMISSIAAGYFLQEYQVMRLIVFLDPYIDPKGTGWHIIQSITAVGSGGFTGKGFLQGTQSHYQFLPQQSTDFIFSIISEEWGFIGGVAIIVLFGLILVRGLFILYTTKDYYAVCIGSGIVGMFFFHVVVNIGMATGSMPITGIPLFFLSYGGSSLWTGMISIGLLVNIHFRRYNY